MLFLGTAKAQDGPRCQPFFAMKEGVVFEMTNYKDNGKVTGSSKHTVLSRGSTSKKDSVVVRCDRMDKNGEAIGSSRYYVGCDAGTFSIDFSVFMNNRSLAAYKGIETRASDQHLEVPGGIKVGDQLIEGTMKVELEEEAITYTRSEIFVYDRFVVAKDSITTPAGTFECFKVDYKMETKVRGIKDVIVQSSGSEWYALGVGIVRSEYYDREGKRYAYSEMTSLTK